MGLAFGLNPGLRWWTAPWWATNLAASQTDSGIPAIGPAGVKSISFANDVWLVGISVNLENGNTTGTLTVTPFLNDSTDPGAAYDLAIADSAANVSAVKLFTVPVFVPANTRVRVKFTTDGTWNGTAGDMNSCLFFQNA